VEALAGDGEGTHFGLLDLDALSSSQAIFRPVLVVVAAISSTMAARLVSGWARQFCEIWQNRRCSILFYFEVPGG
jgi:hypothetical protein